MPHKKRKYTRKVPTKSLTRKQKGLSPKGGGWRRWSVEGKKGGEWRRTGDPPLDKSGKPRQWAGGGVTRGGTFRETSPEDRERRRSVINKFRGLSGRSKFGPGAPLTVGLPGGSTARLSPEDRAKLISAEERYGEDVEDSLRGQFFLRSEVEEFEAGEREQEIGDIQAEAGPSEGIVPPEGAVRPEGAEEKRGFGERLLEVDPRIGEQLSETIFSVGRGGRGANIFGKAKTGIKPTPGSTLPASVNAQTNYPTIVGGGPVMGDIIPEATKASSRIGREIKVNALVRGGLFEKSTAKRMVVQSEGTKVEKVIEILNRPQTALLGFSIKKVGLTAAGLNFISNWYAADNLVDGAVINLGIVTRGLQRGERDAEGNLIITHDYAMEQLETLGAQIDLGINHVTWSTILNPGFWAYGRFYNTAMSKKREQFEAYKQQIENWAGAAESSSLKKFGSSV